LQVSLADGTGAVRWRVLDTVGRMVDQGTWSEGPLHRLGTAAYPSGRYTLELLLNDARVRSAFAVVR
jgi:hypothetical protein